MGPFLISKRNQHIFSFFLNAFFYLLNYTLCNVLGYGYQIFFLKIGELILLPM